MLEEGTGYTRVRIRMSLSINGGDWIVSMGHI